MDRLRILAETQGYFTRTDAFEVGHDDTSIRRALKAKLWVRLRQGTYTYADLWASASEADLHVARARAVARKLGHRVALSHTSAVLEQKLTVWGADLSAVHVTRLDGGAGHTEAGVIHHEGFCTEADLVEIDGILVVRSTRAAVECASLLTTEGALVVLDGLLRSGCPREELLTMFAQMGRWPGMQSLQVAVRMADGRAESVGESRSRHLCYAHGLPAPQLQFPVHDASGALIGTTDFAWPDHGLLGEFDGKVKYGRLLRPGEEPGDAVFREKVREDRLREALQWGMVRIVWSDLYRGAETAARIRRMLRRAA
jgi:putative AbiEi antitoxin of type IV toxin-antitoxin system